MKKKVVIATIDEAGMMGVHAISMVDAPAIMQDFVALAKGNRVKLSSLDSERRMLYGPALIPDLHILRIDDNMEEYYMTFPKETIVRTSQLFMQKSNQSNATVMHAMNVDGCTVVETWLKEGEQDKSTHLGFDLPDGTWMIGMKIENDEVWKDVKRGTLKGFSVEAFYNMMSQRMCNEISLDDTLINFEKELKAALK